jgi:type II secretory pathway component PulK
MRAQHQSDERGFALVVVISVLAVLALLASGFAVATRQETKIVRNTMALARARVRADAGVALAEMGLLSRDPLARWHADDRPYALAFGGGDIRVSVQDEAGKIDLNWTPVPVIEGLLAALAIDPEAPTGAARCACRRCRRARLPDPRRAAGRRYAISPPHPFARSMSC